MKLFFKLGLLLFAIGSASSEILVIENGDKDEGITAPTKDAVGLTMGEVYDVYTNAGSEKEPKLGVFVDSVFLVKVKGQTLSFAEIWFGEKKYIKPGYLVVSTGRKMFDKAPVVAATATAATPPAQPAESAPPTSSEDGFRVSMGFESGFNFYDQTVSDTSGITDAKGDLTWQSTRTNFYLDLTYVELGCGLVISQTEATLKTVVTKPFSMNSTSSNSGFSLMTSEYYAFVKYPIRWGSFVLSPKVGLDQSSFFHGQPSKLGYYSQDDKDNFGKLYLSFGLDLGLKLSQYIYLRTPVTLDYALFPKPKTPATNTGYNILRLNVNAGLGFSF